MTCIIIIFLIKVQLKTGEFSSTVSLFIQTSQDPTRKLQMNCWTRLQVADTGYHLIVMFFLMSYRNGKNYVETGFEKTTPTKPSTPGDGKAAHSKMATFIPPFFKNAKTESCKSTVLKNNIRTSSAFVPPFKKQRNIVQESSSKPQEEDKLHHLSVTPFNSNDYVPPTKKTQSTTDVTGNKSKEDIQRVALAATTNNKLRNNQNHPVGCGSEDYAAEASCVEDTLSRSQGVVTFLDEVSMIHPTLHNR